MNQSISMSPASTSKQKEADQDVDLESVFPSSKIKSILRKEEKIGRVYTSAVDLLGASSALFLKTFTNSIITIAKNKQNEKNNQKITITPEHIRQCIIEKGNAYDFIKDIAESSVGGSSSSKIPNYSQIQNSKNISNQRSRSETSCNNKRSISNCTDNSNNDDVIEEEQKKKKIKISDGNGNGNGNAKYNGKGIGLGLLEVENSDYMNTNLNTGRRFSDDEVIEDDEDYD